MSKFRVTVLRDFYETHSAEVEVTAKSYKQAEGLALKKAEKLGSRSWDLDDEGDYEYEVEDVEEV